MENLTAREKEVARLVSLGFNNKQIAKEMFISVSTVKTNLEHIFEKTNLKNRVQLAVKYILENM